MKKLTLIEVDREIAEILSPELKALPKLEGNGAKSKRDSIQKLLMAARQMRAVRPEFDPSKQEFGAPQRQNAISNAHIDYDWESGTREISAMLDHDLNPDHPQIKQWIGNIVEEASNYGTKEIFEAAGIPKGTREKEIDYAQAVAIKSELDKRWKKWRDTTLPEAENRVQADQLLHERWKSRKRGS